MSGGSVRLDVTMEYPLAVDELQPLDQLVEIFLDSLLLKWLFAFLDVLVHVSLHQFEHQRQSLLWFVTVK